MNNFEPVALTVGDSDELNQVVFLLREFFGEILLLLGSDERVSDDILLLEGVFQTTEQDIRYLPWQSKTILVSNIETSRLDSEFCSENSINLKCFDTVEALLFNLPILANASPYDLLFCRFQQEGREKAVQKSFVIYVTTDNFEEFNEFYNKYWLPLIETEHGWFLRCFTCSQIIFKKLQDLSFLDSWLLKKEEELKNHLEYGFYFIFLQNRFDIIDMVLTSHFQNGIGILKCNSEAGNQNILFFHQFYLLLKHLNNSFSERNDKIVQCRRSSAEKILLKGLLYRELTLLAHIGLYEEENDGVWQKEPVAWFHFEQDLNQKQINWQRKSWQIYNLEEDQTLKITINGREKREYTIIKNSIFQFDLMNDADKMPHKISIRIEMLKFGSNLKNSENKDLRSLGIKHLFI